MISSTTPARTRRGLCDGLRTVLVAFGLVLGACTEGEGIGRVSVGAKEDAGGPSADSPLEALKDGGIRGAAPASTGGLDANDVDAGGRRPRGGTGSPGSPFSAGASVDRGDAGSPSDATESSNDASLPSRDALEALRAKVGARSVPIEHPEKLRRFFASLDELSDDSTPLEAEKAKENVHVLVLGDSHIAADYITRTVRRRLQARHGEAGRGFVVIDQRVNFGGRRVDRRGYVRTRIVDKRGRGKPFGFAGQTLTSVRPGAKAVFKLLPEERVATLYYQAHPRGPRIRVMARGQTLLRLSTTSRTARGVRRRIVLPPAEEGVDLELDPLEIVAEGRGARLNGISYETGKSGLILDAVGPVGADAKVYLSLGQRSFREHLVALKPALVILWLGGNDALAIRQGRRSAPMVKEQFRSLVRRLRKNLPKADCLLWAPMDAGERENGDEGPIVTKSHIALVRDIVRNVAAESGCAYWDTFEAMGAEDSFGRWHAEGLMNDDLIHPKALGGELLGHLAASALEDARDRPK